MDRGWRRSGALFYLPDASRSCCPHYTIRLPAAEFKPTRDQRQALNRWNRFVLGDKYISEVNKRHPKSKEEKKRANSDFDLITSIHESEVSQLKSGIQADHRFEVTLENDIFTEEKYVLFQNYQQHVHHESDADITRQGFERFLCSSPLHRHNELAPKKLGSFHQCYRLDGLLIAMSVLDLLPHAVSGVYFLYHSDVEKWSFGKLSALREAAMALANGYEFYYMGYYIHSCKKMRYKGEYKPQHVLDYNNFEWDLLDDKMRALMEKTKWASMSRERERLKSANGVLAEADLANDNDASQDKADNDPLGQTNVKHPSPLDAMDSGLSLLELGMPGVMTRDEMHALINLDEMRVYLGRGRVHEMQHIVAWRGSSEDNLSSTKGVIAEYAGVVGSETANDVIVDLSR